MTYLRAQPADLVLLDVMMPGYFNGLSVLKIMRDTPEMAGTPVIMTTALADLHHVKTALGLGVAHYMTKPFKLRELTERVQTLLLRRPQRQGTVASPPPGSAQKKVLVPAIQVESSAPGVASRSSRGSSRATRA